jgi:Fe-S oxidoreductase
MGQPEEVIVEQMNTNLEAIKATGADTVIFSCAGCLRMFQEEYSRFIELPFRALHFTQWLEEVDLDLKPYNRTTTYHDPCHIGRHLGIYDAPRNVIGKIPGITFLEMEDSRETARCCGGGGGVRSGFPDISRQIAARRVAQANIADVLLTTCPFCVNNLKLGKEALNSKIEVRDLLEVVDELL